LTEPTEKSKHLKKFVATDKYKSGYDLIFGKKEEPEKKEPQKPT